MLEMKPRCERCQSQLTVASEAYICSYECTFCAACHAALKAVCPNCSGELVRRPRRHASAADSSEGDQT